MKIIDDLVNIDGVLEAMLVGKDGLVVASSLLDEDDSEVLGAMVAMMYGTISKGAGRIGLGMPGNAIVETATGSIHIVESEDMLLVLITDHQVNQGVLRIAARKAGRRVREAIPL